MSAVPTDVRARKVYGLARAHDGAVVPRPFGMQVDSPEVSHYVVGVATCEIRRPSLPAKRFVLSCRHVLSCTNQVTDPDQRELPVLPGTREQPLLGRTTGVRGRLGDGTDYSFDAQLLELAPHADPASLLSGLSFDGPDSYVLSPGEVGQGFWVATGRADNDGQRLLVWVDYVETLPDFEMVYRIGGVDRKVYHRQVLHGRPRAPLIDGDSGSPAVRVRHGQRLVGMYIGGNSRHAFVIPAWQLLVPRNYGCVDESGWTLG